MQQTVDAPGLPPPPLPPKRERASAAATQPEVLECWCMGPPYKHHQQQQGQKLPAAGGCLQQVQQLDLL
jgi:hypothetical protein